MYENHRFMQFLTKLQQRPNAIAKICGSCDYPDIYGKGYFYQTYCGVLVAVQVTGLPKKGIFALHIHSGNCCTGNENDPFADAMTHYNPENNPHPYHAGDLPPLFGNKGEAFQVVLTDRFSICEIVNRTIIIHSAPDDFTTQPAGNSGEKIACGVIKACCW